MFEAFVLAGGRSSRMGREKSSIHVDGRTMLDHTAAALRESGAEKVTVVSSKEPVEGYETIPDVYEGKGALAGIHSALKNTNGTFAVITACDLPFISSEFLTQLVGIFTSGHHDCVIPEQPDGRLQPLAAVYSRERSLAVCDALLKDETSSHAVKALLDRLEKRILRFDEYAHLANSRNLLINVNTPEELERALSLADRV